MKSQKITENNVQKRSQTQKNHHSLSLGINAFKYHRADNYRSLLVTMASPQAVAAAAKMVPLLVGAGGLLYAANNCLFNVEGGHRAIVFNRIGGIKSTVR